MRIIPTMKSKGLIEESIIVELVVNSCGKGECIFPPYISESVKNRIDQFLAPFVYPPLITIELMKAIILYMLMILRIKVECDFISLIQGVVFNHLEKCDGYTIGEL